MRGAGRRHGSGGGWRSGSRRPYDRHPARLRPRRRQPAYRVRDRDRDGRGPQRDRRRQLGRAHRAARRGRDSLGNRARPEARAAGSSAGGLARDRRAASRGHAASRGRAGAAPGGPSNMTGDALEIVAGLAAPYGLNLAAAIPAARYAATGAAAAAGVRAAHPRARSLIVLGNGGGGLWHALQAHATARPGWWQREHPLDDFTREVVERTILPALAGRGFDAAAAFPFLDTPASFNFVELARLAGLGAPSLLGTLVHPLYGPWIAFRALIL